MSTGFSKINFFDIMVSAEAVSKELQYSMIKNWTKRNLFEHSKDINLLTLKFPLLDHIGSDVSRTWNPHLLECVFI